MEHKVKFTFFTEPPVSAGGTQPRGQYRRRYRENTCTFEISVQPGAQLFINNIDYTDQVGPDGLATIDAQTSPGTDEMPVHIRASLEATMRMQRRPLTLIPGRIQEATESLLVLNESIPLTSHRDRREVKLTGHVPPGATIETNLIQSVAACHRSVKTGAFSLTVKIYEPARDTACASLQVFLDGTQVDQKEVIIDKTSTFNEYTTGPVGTYSPYASYKN